MVLTSSERSLLPTIPPILSLMVSRAEDAAVAEQLQELQRHHADRHGDEIVSYYPPEARSDRHLFGVAGAHVDGTRWSVGDSGTRFPLQSISKVSTYALALEDHGRAGVLRRVGVEPSGDPFNSISFDDIRNRPHNPMINSGALVAAALVSGSDGVEKVDRLLERLRAFTGNPALAVDDEVLAAQLVSADRNLALAHLMRSLGMLDGDIAEHLEVYLSMCSVMVTSDELALMGATLARGGVNPVTHARAMPAEHVRDVVTVMATCGMYDAAGQWLYDVGIPAKSGVAGGILGTIPDRIGFGVYSPGLDVHGNSVRGVALCRDLSERFGLHVFADPTQARFGRPEAR